MKGKLFRLVLINAVIVLAVFFLVLLAIGWALPALAVFEGAFVRWTLAAFAVLALIATILDLKRLLRANKEKAQENAPGGSGGEAR